MVKTARMLIKLFGSPLSALQRQGQGIIVYVQEDYAQRGYFQGDLLRFWRKGGDVETSGYEAASQVFLTDILFSFDGRFSFMHNV